MKKKFSKKWKSSKRPGKKRKYSANAPIHIKRKQLSVNLSKELRKKHGKRNVVLRKDDVVRVLRGKFKGKKGKVFSVDIKNLRVEVEEVQATKQDGSKINMPVNPSNLQIVELNLEDKKRFGEKGNVKGDKVKEAKGSKKEDKVKTKSKSKTKEKKK